MPVFSDDFEDPTPLPDPEHSKVPTTQRHDQTPEAFDGRPMEPSTGSPADGLHPERTAAIAAGDDPDKAGQAPRTDPGSPGLVVDKDGDLVPNPDKEDTRTAAVKKVTGLRKPAKK
jgi:hypothetical protein